MGSSSDALRRQQQQEAVDRVVEPARQETRCVRACVRACMRACTQQHPPPRHPPPCSSTLRFYLFGLLALLLAAAVVGDLTSVSPSPLQDALYTLLAAALAWTAVRERAGAR